MTAAGLCFLSMIVCGWGLDQYSLFNITEAKQAEIARQILVRSNWITPVYNGEIYFDKPILLHWLMAFGFSMLGVNEWAVRLPSAIASTILILTTWLFTSKFQNQRTAVLTATILLANPLTLFLGRTGQHDMLMTCFMAIALYCWYWAYSTGQRWSYFSFFIFLALAVLSKGPLAFILCSLIIGIFLTCVGRWREQWKAMPHGWGLALFGGITLPWYILVIKENGWEFIHQAFIYNNVDRFLTPNLNQVGPWYYYLPVILVGLSTWAVFLPTLLIRQTGMRSRVLQRWRQGSPTEQLNLFMGIWALVVLVFMSLSATKLPWYIYPAFPALAYFCAQAWNQQAFKSDRWLYPGLGLTCLIYSLLAIGFALALRWLPDLAIATSLNHTGAIESLALTYGIAAGAIGFTAIKKQVMAAWMINLSCFSLLALITVNLLLPALDQSVLGGRLLPIAQALGHQVCDRCPHKMAVALGVVEPSLNFYSRLSYIQKFDEPFDQAQIQASLHQPQPIWLVTTAAHLQKAGVDANHWQIAYDSDPYQLWMISPYSP